MIDIAKQVSVAAVSEAAAELWGEATALHFQSSQLSFAALEANANKIAQALLEAGVQSGERIAYLGKNNTAFYEVLFGACKVRCAVTPVNYRLAAPEIAFILNDCKASVVFVGKDSEPLLEAILDQCPRVSTIISIDGGHTVWPDYVYWRDTHPALHPRMRAEPTDDVLQLYTSGTTGRPKGVQLTNANYLAFLRLALQLEWANYRPGERVLLAMPMFHVAGANAGLLTIAQGAACVVLKEVNPGDILTSLTQQKIQHAFFVPAVIQMLLQIPGIEQADFSDLKQIFYGASPIAQSILQRAQAVFGCRFTQLYGLTETCGAGTFLPHEAHDPRWDKQRSCGVPWPGVIVRCVNSNAEEVPVGEVGEIVIHSPVVMAGYYNRADATADALDGQWFRTGDAGYFDADGFLFIYDRVRDMIVTGGENVYPAEVENAIFSHPGVADVAVIGVPDENWGEAIKAMVVVKPGHSLTDDELMRHTRGRIANYKVPKSVDFVTSLPRNASGKLLRKDLREPFWAGRERRVG